MLLLQDKLLRMTHEIRGDRQVRYQACVEGQKVLLVAPPLHGHLFLSLGECAAHVSAACVSGDSGRAGEGRRGLAALQAALCRSQGGGRTQCTAAADWTSAPWSATPAGV